jgi:hypothetical protein
VVYFRFCDQRDVMQLYSLKTSLSHGGSVAEIAPGYWRLGLPPGPADEYRWAQLDDYHHLARRDFPLKPPVRIQVHMRVSNPILPGTWGFGIWNDPFSINLGLGGIARRLPALPSTAWFFHASPPNWLTLRDDQPAEGFLAATFSSPAIPAWLLAPAALALPLLYFAPTASLIRRAARVFIKESAIQVGVNGMEWNLYEIEWLNQAVRFRVNGNLCMETKIIPRGQQGLVIWLDNQFLNWQDGNRLRFGTMACDTPSWLEVRELEVKEAV